MTSSRHPVRRNHILSSRLRLQQFSSCSPLAEHFMHSPIRPYAAYCLFSEMLSSCFQITLAANTANCILGGGGVVFICYFLGQGLFLVSAQRMNSVSASKADGSKEVFLGRTQQCWQPGAAPGERDGSGGDFPTRYQSSPLQCALEGCLRFPLRLFWFSPIPEHSISMEGISLLHTPLQAVLPTGCSTS